MKNKTFLATLALLTLAFGFVACSEPEPEVEVIEQEEVLVDPVEETDELQDLDQKIEDPELQDPNVKFEENLEVYAD